MTLRNDYLETVKQIQSIRRELKPLAAERAKVAAELLAPLAPVDARIAELKALDEGYVEIWRELHDRLASEREDTLLAGTPAEPMPSPKGTSIRKSWAYSVTDPAAVPREYLIVDLKAVKQAEAPPPGTERSPFYSLVIRG